MRKHISLAFYCLASVVILLQLATSFVSLTSEQSQQQLLHSVTKPVEKPVVVVESKPQVDFKQMAQDMESEQY